MVKASSKRIDFYNQKDVWINYIDEANKLRINETIKMIPQVQSILEIGCGSGLILNKLSSNCVIGLDLSRVALEQVTHEKVIGSCDQLPFKNSSLDVVIAAELLEHLDNENLKKTLSEMYMVACEYILVSVPYKERPWETFVKCANCGNVYSPYGHQQYFDEKRTRNLIKSKHQKIKLVGIKRRLPFLGRIMQKSGVYGYRKNSICPLCGSRKLRYGKVEKIVNLVLGRLTKLAHPEPNWILCLYELRSKNEIEKSKKKN